MGWAKREYMEQQARGYGSIAKVVCKNCLGDYALKELIATKGSKAKCDYCQKTALCIGVEELLEVIMEGISYEYEEAVECMGIDQGEFVGAEIWDTPDLLDHIYEEIQAADALHEDLKATINDTTWCEKDPYGLRQSQERSSMWNAFCQLVKTKTRYVFFRMPEQNEYREEAAFSILDHIGEEVTNLGLIEEIAQGSNFLRGRMHDQENPLKEAQDLSSPPCHKAKANRMSAEGISIFYGAHDEITAVTEIYNSRYNYATVAAFQNTRPFRILNLTKIKDIQFPSLFDKENRGKRESIIFLRDLNKNLTQPIELMEAIEYIPAQIVAEYFRFLYTYEDKSLDGIAYHSSKVEDGVCYALFFDQEECLEAKATEYAFLKKEQVLRMDDRSLRTYKISAGLELKALSF